MVSLKTKFNLTPSNRILQLAQHKESKRTWFTTPGKKLIWGSQEPMCPLSLSALGTGPTPRLNALAQHKKDFSTSQQGTFSKKLIWGSQEPMCPLSLSALGTGPTPRLNALAQHKKDFSTSQQGTFSPAHSDRCEYSCPVWHVSSNARDAVISPRLLQLARPKSTHPNFRSNRQTVETIITHAAKNASPTPRLEQLSVPKLRERSLFYPHGPPETPIWPVSRGARTATASSRVRVLSTPKPLSKDYIPPRDVGRL